jgi:hypothetical protein
VPAEWKTGGWIQRGRRASGAGKMVKRDSAMEEEQLSRRWKMLHIGRKVADRDRRWGECTKVCGHLSPHSLSALNTYTKPPLL